MAGASGSTGPTAQHEPAPNQAPAAPAAPVEGVRSPADGVTHLNGHADGLPAGRTNGAEAGPTAPQNGAPQNGVPQNGAPQNGAPQNGFPQNQAGGNGCTAPQLRRFIKSRPYVPMHELRRRFGINGADDDVTRVPLDAGAVYVGLPEREGALLGELLRGGEIGYELSLDPRSPIVVGVYPMRPVPRG